MFRSVSRIMPFLHVRSQHRPGIRAFSSTPDSHLSTSTSCATVHPSIIPAPELKLCFGADVQAVVHKSVEEMVPIGFTSLPGRIFNAPIRQDLVHRVVIWQLAKRRSGTAKTKNRAEVKGSGRKIRPQKGSGQSRQGAITSPIFRGGGRAQGPVQRDFSYTLPHNVRRHGLRSILSSKFANGQLWIVENAKIHEAKTRHVVEACERYDWKSVLIVDDDPDGVVGVDPSLHAASHNIRGTLAMNAQGLNVYDVLSFDMLVLTKPALQHLSERFAKYDWLV